MEKTNKVVRKIEEGHENEGGNKRVHVNYPSVETIHFRVPATEMY